MVPLAEGWMSRPFWAPPADERSSTREQGRRYPGSRLRATGGAGVLAGAQPRVERLSELRDLLHDHLDPRRLLHDLLPGVEQRRPRGHLVGMAADQRGDPPDRVLH